MNRLEVRGVFEVKETTTDNKENLQKKYIICSKFSTIYHGVFKIGDLKQLARFICEIEKIVVHCIRFAKLLKDKDDFRNNLEMVPLLKYVFINKEERM
jgi:hypothetical protein